MTAMTVLRRAFVLLAAMAAVAACTVAVDRVRGDTYKGESVLVVPDGSGSGGPGQVDQAGRLAETYAGIVAEDRAVLRRAAQAAGVSTREAERGLTLRQRAETAIVSLRFTAPGRESALRGAEAAAKSISGPSPVSEAVAPRSLKTIRPPRVRQGVTGYTAETLLAVPTGAGTTGPGNADQANKLAVTYAAAIPDDDGVLGHAARRLGSSPAEVQSHLTATNENQTSIVRVTYKEKDRARAKAGIAAVTEALSSDEPVARSIPPRGLDVVRAPSVAGSSGPSPPMLVAAGAVLGLALGIVLLIALERAQPRVRDPRDLAAATGAPVSRLRDFGPGSAASLLERWRELGNGGGGTVALVPADRRSADATRELARALASNGRAEGVDVDVSGLYGANGNGGVGPDVRIVTASPGPEGAAVVRHAGPGVAVVVAQSGTRAESVRDVALRLGDFGITPGWALLVDRRGRRDLDDIG
jgi:capsular polysaccharide biosynthesis protein